MKSLFLKILVLSLISGVFCVILEHGYGRADISAFAVWTVFFSLLFALIGNMLIRQTNKLSAWAQGVLLLISVTALSLLWGRGFPVTLCWITGAVSATLFQAFVSKHSNKNRRYTLAIGLGTLSLVFWVPTIVSKYSYCITVSPHPCPTS